MCQNLWVGRVYFGMIQIVVDEDGPTECLVADAVRQFSGTSSLHGLVKLAILKEEPNHLADFIIVYIRFDLNKIILSQSYLLALPDVLAGQEQIPPGNFLCPKLLIGDPVGAEAGLVEIIRSHQRYKGDGGDQQQLHQGDALFPQKYYPFIKLARAGW